MRYVVLIFGLIGVGWSGFISYRWGTEWIEHHVEIDSTMAFLKPPLPQNQLVTDMREFYTRQRALPFIMGGTVLGLFGTMLSFGGRGLSGGALLLVIGAGPAVFAPNYLMITGSFLIAGVFSLFVRPRTPRPAKERTPVDDDDA